MFTGTSLRTATYNGKNVDEKPKILRIDTAYAYVEISGKKSTHFSMKMSRVVTDLSRQVKKKTFENHQ